MSAPARGPVLTRLSPVAETAQSSLRTRVRRVRNAGFAIVQTGIAAGLAWFMAKLIVGTPDPFFAPAAAVISVGLQRGQPLRRSAELSAGVAIGIGVAFLLRSAIGLGPVQIGAIVALTILAALLVHASIVLVNQAAISAVLVMTLPNAALGNGPDRFFDALIGVPWRSSSVSWAFARNPASSVIELAGDVLGELAAKLRDGALALERAELARAQAALDSLRALDGTIAQLFDALARAQEAAAFSPTRRRSRDALEPHGPAARQIDYAVRNGRVLCARSRPRFAPVSAPAGARTVDPHAGGLGRCARAPAGRGRRRGHDSRARDPCRARGDRDPREPERPANDDDRRAGSGHGRRPAPRERSRGRGRARRAPPGAA